MPSSRRSDRSDRRRSIALSACAHEGGGKSTFMLSAPKPIALFYIDQNTQEIVDKEGFTDNPDVEQHEIQYPATAFGDKDDIKDQAETIWQDDFIEPMLKVLKRKGDYRTIVIDTATELRDLQLLKWFGKTAQIIKELYTGPNMELKGLYNSLRYSGLNVVLTHRLKDVYESKIKRGRNGPEEVREKVEGAHERDGWNKTGFYVNSEVFLLHDPEKSDKLAGQFGMRIVRSTARPALINTEYWGREKQEDGTRIRRASFPYLATQMYPTTTLEDWI